MVQITILGAGPAGLSAAWRLARRKELDAKITLLEKENGVGGLARSFEHQGLYFDLGSHRLHPSCSPEILEDIKLALGGDCLLRPRNGRILLKGRFIQGGVTVHIFPSRLKPVPILIPWSEMPDQKIPNQLKVAWATILSKCCIHLMDRFPARAPKNPSDVPR